MIYVLWYPLWLPIIFDNIFILGRTLSQYPPQWIFALISFVCIWVLFARQQESIFAGDTVLFLEEEVRMLCFVSSSKAIRQIRQGALSARLQEGFSLRMEQLNNCYYLQWAKRRSILRTIRKDTNRKSEMWKKIFWKESFNSSKRKYQINWPKDFDFSYNKLRGNLTPGLVLLVVLQLNKYPGSFDLSGLLGFVCLICA